MTYKMESGNGVFHCDECSEHIETEANNFHDAFEEAKEKGWRAYIGPDKKWAHSCPACAEDFAKEKR